jgi:hypothetical protein
MFPAALNTIYRRLGRRRTVSWVLLILGPPGNHTGRNRVQPIGNGCARTMDLGVLLGESEKKKKRLRSASSSNGERPRPSPQAVSGRSGDLFARRSARGGIFSRKRLHQAVDRRPQRSGGRSCAARPGRFFRRPLPPRHASLRDRDRPHRLQRCPRNHRRALPNGARSPGLCGNVRHVFGAALCRRPRAADQSSHAFRRATFGIHLLRLASSNREDHALPIPISQSLFAKMIGTTRSRVSFFMNRFKRKGFIEYGHDGRIRVHQSLRSAVVEDWF